MICIEITASPNESPLVVSTTDPISSDEMGAPFIIIKVVFLGIILLMGLYSLVLSSSCLIKFDLSKILIQSLVFLGLCISKNPLFSFKFMFLQSANADSRSPFFEGFEICLPAMRIAGIENSFRNQISIF